MSSILQNPAPNLQTVLGGAAVHKVAAPPSAQRILALLRKIRQGHLTIHLPDGSVQHAGHPGHVLHASIEIHNWQVFAETLKSGDIGFAESFIAGHWHSPDPVALLRLFIQNRNAMEDLMYGRWWGALFYRLRHWLRRNTKHNSSKNIHAHYDLGNDFYRLWLDGSMNYSSALFSGNSSQPMRAAQDAKVRRALSMVRAGAGQKLLEIGCGWGALAEMACTEFGSHLTGVTLSSEQLRFAQQRMADCGAQSQTDLRLQDYRDIANTDGAASFDAICSIEMVEAVGRQYWPTYFSTVAKLLKPGGRACVQSIVIADGLFERYIRGTDFIQQYIFPGGCLPSPSVFRMEARRAGLEVVDEFAFGLGYAETLRRWRASFDAERQAVLAQGYDEKFLRTWSFYLVYCEAAFMENNTDVVQFTLQKPL